MHPIRVYCPNLNDRLDRRKHIEQEFRNKPEFLLTIVPAIQDRRFQHANAPPAKLKNIFVKTLKRGTKI